MVNTIVAEMALPNFVLRNPSHPSQTLGFDLRLGTAY